MVNTHTRLLSLTTYFVLLHAHCLIGFGYSGAAHTEADLGGEFMCAYEIDISFLTNQWYLPSKDLAAIFASMGYDKVTPDVLEMCNTELYAEVEAIKVRCVCIVLDACLRV
jgi:hypothetical protein